MFTDMPLKILAIAILGLITACGSGGIGSDNQDPDPVVADFPIAYVKRPTVVANEDNRTLITDDVRSPLAFRRGAKLFLRDQASPSAAEKNISSRAFPADEFANDDGVVLYDVRDLHASFDGNKLLFAMRAPEIEGADEDEQPTWNIWEYQRNTDTLRRVIESDNGAEAGQDIAPHYLADGRIVFSSTRQRTSKAILLDEGKPQFDALNESGNQPALNLHRMTADGTDITQITFNQSSDLNPVVLQDGKVLYTRWDNAGSRNRMNLYRVNPDGSEMEIVYGNHSHDTGTDNTAVQFIRPKVLEDGRIMVSLRPFTSRFYGGDLVAVDSNNFTDINVPTYANQGLQTAGQESLTPGQVQTGSGFNKAGRYASADPLWDGTHRLLVSWSPCRLEDISTTSAITDDSEENNPPRITGCTDERLQSANFQAAEPLYSLWIYDPVAGTQRPLMVPEEGVMYSEAVVLQVRPRPVFLADLADSANVDTELLENDFAVVNIRSVYDIDGVDSSEQGIRVLADPLLTDSAARPARFLRITKAVSLPDDDVVEIPGFAFGRAGSQGMKEILGYVPVEPDGSAMFKVPANVAFALSVLDEKGRRISPRHQNWLHLKAGETLQCLGCHTGNSEQPHGRIDAQPPSVNAGALTSGLPFPNTDPALFADMGETMAETFARINGGARSLNSDLEYIDEWSDPALQTKAASFSYSYRDLHSEAPILPGCADEWGPFCRIIINYETNIHPLWAVDRRVLEFNDLTMEDEVIEDNTCTSCHGPLDLKNDNVAQVPAAQLDLTDGPGEDGEQFKSYIELFIGDNEQEVVDGVLQDRLVQAVEDGEPVFARDEEGNLLLDEMANPIPVLVTVAVPAVLSSAGANANADVLDLFNASGTHAGRLSEAELKLIAEWLDIGGQYYNNPFAIPQD